MELSDHHPRFPLIGGLAGPRADLDVVAVRKIHIPAQNRSPLMQRISTHITGRTVKSLYDQGNCDLPFHLGEWLGWKTLHN
jgi:hypothetical protein